jgi:hypothetical protein
MYLCKKALICKHVDECTHAKPHEYYRSCKKVCVVDEMNTTCDVVK